MLYLTHLIVGIHRCESFTALTSRLSNDFLKFVYCHNKYEIDHYYYYHDGLDWYGLDRFEHGWWSAVFAHLSMELLPTGIIEKRKIWCHPFNNELRIASAIHQVHLTEVNPEVEKIISIISEIYETHYDIYETQIV